MIQHQSLSSPSVFSYFLHRLQTRILQDGQWAPGFVFLSKTESHRSHWPVTSTLLDLKEITWLNQATLVNVVTFVVMGVYDTWWTLTPPPPPQQGYLNFLKWQPCHFPVMVIYFVYVDLPTVLLMFLNKLASCPVENSLALALNSLGLFTYKIVCP